MDQAWFFLALFLGTPALFDLGFGKGSRFERYNFGGGGLQVKPISGLGEREVQQRQSLQVAPQIWRFVRGQFRQFGQDPPNFLLFL